MATADHRMVHQPGVGGIVRDLAAFQRPRHLRQEPPLRPDQHRDPIQREPVAQVDSLYLGRDPLGFGGVLIEGMGLDGAARRGRGHPHSGTG